MDSDFPEITVSRLISQSELNDLVRELSLSKIQAKISAPCLKGWNLLQQGVKNVTQETPAMIVIIFF
jgi:hypothetical protein